MKLVLASKSPRRREILSMVTSNFEVRISGAEEIIPSGTDVFDVPTCLAKIKAETTEASDDEIVIGCDTVVIHNGKILGKPHSEGEATEMLRFLSGRSHYVFTGVTVICDGRIETAICRTEVFFKNLSDGLIRAYVHTGEPYDKAGGYGIQSKGAVLVDHIDGDYSNVVGLPIGLLYEMLTEFGIDVL